jgi:hypothetical protein
MLGDDYSYAVAFVNRRTDGYPYLKSITLAETGLTNARGYDFQDLAHCLDINCLWQGFPKCATRRPGAP